MSEPRVAIVTGAARGIGAATARRLAEDGMVVAVLDLEEAAAKSTVDAIEDAGGRALAVGADVSDTDQVSTSALGNRGQANYAAAKAGMQGFTKTLALELGKFGITVNAIAPGFIATDMTKATAARIGEDWDAYLAKRAAAIPVARAGQPEDIANAVSFFVGEQAGFVSGQVLYVAGGPKG